MIPTFSILAARIGLALGLNLGHGAHRALWHKRNRPAHAYGLCWFPDGKRLAYVELLPKEQLKRFLEKNDAFGATYKAWDAIPAVHIVDTQTGKKRFIHLGWRPVVSLDGKEILLYDYAGNKRLVEIATGRARAVQWPGSVWYATLAILPKDSVLYLGLPTTGTVPRSTENNSPLAGPKSVLTIKVAQINSQKFQTLVPYVDSRTAMSFGALPPGRLREEAQGK